MPPIPYQDIGVTWHVTCRCFLYQNDIDDVKCAWSSSSSCSLVHSNMYMVSDKTELESETPGPALARTWLTLTSSSMPRSTCWRSSCCLTTPLVHSPSHTLRSCLLGHVVLVAKWHFSSSLFSFFIIIISVLEFSINMYSGWKVTKHLVFYL